MSSPVRSPSQPAAGVRAVICAGRAQAVGAAPASAFPPPPARAPSRSRVLREPAAAGRGSSFSECRPNCARWNCRMMWCIRSTRRSNSSRSASSASAAARRPGMSSGSASAVVIAPGFDHNPPRMARSFGRPDSICRGARVWGSRLGLASGARVWGSRLGLASGARVWGSRLGLSVSLAAARSAARAPASSRALQRERRAAPATAASPHR
jgi:hypothetical protein